jgi:hypothetical protein
MPFQDRIIHFRFLHILNERLFRVEKYARKKHPPPNRVAVTKEQEPKIVKAWLPFFRKKAVFDRKASGKTIF